MGVEVDEDGCVCNVEMGQAPNRSQFEARPVVPEPQTTRNNANLHVKKIL